MDGQMDNWTQALLTPEKVSFPGTQNQSERKTDQAAEGGNEQKDPKQIGSICARQLF